MVKMDAVGARRLVALGLTDPKAVRPEDAVRRLLAVQGQDLPGAAASIALRTAGPLGGHARRDDVAAAFDDGRLVRSWTMRGTLHVVAAEDLRRLLSLCAARMATVLAGRSERLGFDEADHLTARRVAEAFLAAGPAPRADLMEALRAAGLPTDRTLGYHLIVRLAHDGVICLGPWAGKEQCVVLVDGWVPDGPGPDGDEALLEVATRYVSGHGPATAADLARWTGLPLGAVKRALAAAGDDLATVDIDGTTHFADPAVLDASPSRLQDAGRVMLLPGFDELILGYADRRAVIDPSHFERLVPGANGIFRPTVVHQGRIVATWRFRGSGRSARIEVDPFMPLSADVSETINDLAAAWP